MPTEAPLYGIENLKKLVHFGCAFMRQVFVSGSDGWKWTDAFAFIDEVAEIPGVVKSLPAIKQELADLDIAERKELYDYIVEEFDIPNDRVEMVVEKSLGFAITGVALYEEWKTIKG